MQPSHSIKVQNTQVGYVERERIILANKHSACVRNHRACIMYHSDARVRGALQNVLEQYKAVMLSWRVKRVAIVEIC